MEKSKICETGVGDFFTQRLVVGSIDAHSWDYCKLLCADKKVLHVGCSDYPLFSSEGSLHLQLVPVAKELHGCDPNGLEELKKHYDGVYYDSINQIDDEYDVVLVPNVIEHLKNPGLMVDELFSIPFKKLFVLVPNYSISEQAVYEKNIFTERVHQDHYAWYSPYTLWNLFKEHIEEWGASCELNFFDNRSMISILITKDE